MKLLDRQGLREDPYRRDGEGPARIVALDSLEEALAGAGPDDRIGLVLPNDVHPGRIRPHQDRLSLVVIAFPKFTDGRGFSVARLLRDSGFGGTLRASGALVPDQFAFALDCGFDEVEIDEERLARQPIEDWLRQTGFFTFSYQPRRDGGPTIFERRAAGRAA